MGWFRTIIIVLSLSAIATACSTDGSAEVAKEPTYTNGDPVDLAVAKEPTYTNGDPMNLAERPEEPDCPDPELPPDLARLMSRICESDTRRLAEWESVAYGTRPPNPTCKDAVAEGISQESQASVQVLYDRICSEGERRLAAWTQSNSISPQIIETADRATGSPDDLEESVEQLEDDVAALKESNDALVMLVSELVEDKDELEATQDEIVEALFGLQNDFSRNTEIYGIDGSVDQLDEDLGKVVAYINCLTDQFRTICTAPLLGY